MTEALRRILVVQEDVDNRRVAETVLRREGYEVASAADGPAALAEVERRRPDLVLLDLKLPKIDGWQLLRRWKAGGELASVPVIALTGLALPGDEERARDAGCDDYLTKPCAVRTLREAVRKWL